MSNEVIENVSFLNWLSRDSMSTMSLAPLASKEMIENSKHFLAEASRDLSDCFHSRGDRNVRYERDVEQYQTLNALGLRVVLTIQWDSKRFRILRSFIPDLRYGTETAMSEQLKLRMPLATFASPIDGFDARTSFARENALKNHVLFTGQLVGHPQSSDPKALSGVNIWEIDQVLEGLSLIGEPFSISLVATPLPPAGLYGVRDFLLAAVGACASGIEVSVSNTRSNSETTGRNELDPDKMLISYKLNNITK